MLGQRNNTTMREYRRLEDVDDNNRHLSLIESPNRHKEYNRDSILDNYNSSGLLYNYTNVDVSIEHSRNASFDT